MAQLMQRETSSFRDKEGFVYYENGEVKRFLTTDEAIGRIDAFLKSSFYETLKPGFVETTIKGNTLIHEKVETITYPYEWSFSMLADAALLQIKIMKKGLGSGYILKDGSAYNCLYHKGRMIFIDILSIDKINNRNLWEGYHQFCEHFLYPLMLKAYKKINFQSLWRGSADGISTYDFNRILSFSDCFKSGVFLHSVLKTHLARTVQKETTINTQVSLSSQINSLKRLVDNLMKVILSLRKNYSSSIWTDYSKTNTYTGEKNNQKRKFIQEFIKALKPTGSLVDIGCNTGEYTQLASQHLSLVKAVDYDADCIDRLYLKILDGSAARNIVPIVADLVNFSPSQGWLLTERKDLISRICSDSFLALALIHHICISKNVPLDYFVEFLSKMGHTGVVEWVGIDDPMVEVLLKNRENIFADYTQENFEKAIMQYFNINSVFQFSNSQRILYRVTRK